MLEVVNRVKNSKGEIIGYDVMDLQTKSITFYNADTAYKMSSQFCNVKYTNIYGFVSKKGYMKITNRILETET